MIVDSNLNFSFIYNSKNIKNIILGCTHLKMDPNTWDLSNVNYLSQIKLESVCRVCLQENEQMISIFDIKDLFASCFALKVSYLLLK